MHLETEAKTTSYTNPRPDVLALVSRGHRSVLDVGCAAGALGADVKFRDGSHVVGIEYDPRTAAQARNVLDHVVTGDLTDWPTISSQLDGRTFDCIICADVLEHLTDPWGVLAGLVQYLRPGGEVVISLPNVGHHNTLWNVFARRRFPRRDRGLHDVTHLRWFGRRDVTDLVSGAGLVMREMRRNYRIIERPTGWNRVARVFALPGVRDLLTYQFLVRAHRPAAQV
jgi:2-polyprenyl-3-methyl-5-hydroxy-6-metoxy-1,4-benzoquinol methylase